MLRIRHLNITINTDKGVFGAKRDFHDGLNVVRAENWAGKSTLLQSIIYALGLEGMFTPSHEVPLPHAVTDYLESSAGRAKVLDSMVSLEIENSKGQFMTAQRSIAGERHRHLITVYDGRAITAQKGLETRTDYFVRERNAATSERGFHAKLVEFIDWTLPTAPRFNDEDCLLYLETIFPLLYVEQKLGWGRIPARFPTWLGIRDVARRTIEFLLGLDAYAIAIERVAVQDEISRLRGEWTTLRSQTAKVVAAAGGLVNALPAEPVSAWPPDVPPHMLMSRSNQWVPFTEYQQVIRERLETLVSATVPSAQAAKPRLQPELQDAEGQLAEREHAIRALLNKIETERDEADALRQRISAVQDDLRKYKDVRRLRKLGSDDAVHLIGAVCPTCHQELVDSLLDTSKKAEPMSVDQNISFYEEQVQLFSAVLSNSEDSIKSSEIQLQAHRAEVEKLRDQIRAIRETLVSASNTPSIEALTERIRLEQRAESLDRLAAQFDDAYSEFGQLAEEWRTVQERRARLPKGALSDQDEGKISALQQSFRDQLIDYKMGSVEPSELNISHDYYQPEIAGLNLGADVSGSDLIRMQWAYLLGLLEVGLHSPGSNHPGVLIMDEPQQQSVEENSFRAMLRYAATRKGAQVIVATSHERRELDQYLAQLADVTLYEYNDERILGRL
ncbi:MAG: hypothetical protein WAM66_06795 [Acidobacteriaceae bacterium]